MVSYEESDRHPQKPTSPQTAFVTAQVEIRATGSIELRYGPSSGIIANNFSAGVANKDFWNPVPFSSCLPHGMCLAGQPYPSLQSALFNCT